MFDIRGSQIVCATNDEKEDVLKYIEENYPEVHWNSHEKPTKFLGYDAPMSIFIGLDSYMWNSRSTESYKHYYDKYMTAKDLIGDFTLPSKEHLMEFLED